MKTVIIKSGWGAFNWHIFMLYTILSVDAFCDLFDTFYIRTRLAVLDMDIITTVVCMHSSILFYSAHRCARC